MLQVVENTGKYSSICLCSSCGNQYEVQNRYGAKKSRIGDICDDCKYLITNMIDITQDKLRQAYLYDVNTGELRYRGNTFTGKAGDIATYPQNHGYLILNIGKKPYLAHRVIFMYMEGYWPAQIDHINHIRTDNRWSNLRDVKHRDNQLNCSVSKNSTVGVNGVSIHKPTGKYRTYITVNSKQKHLGLYASVDEAIHARDLANQQYGFHVNHGK